MAELSVRTMRGKRRHALDPNDGRLTLCGAEPYEAPHAHPVTCVRCNFLLSQEPETSGSVWASRSSQAGTGTSDPLPVDDGGRPGAFGDRLDPAAPEDGA